MSEVTIELKYPVKNGDEQLTSITLRRPLGRDMRRLPAEPSMGHMMELAACVSGLPDVVWDRMDAEDVTRAMEVIAGFLPAGRPDGRKV